MGQSDEWRPWFALATREAGLRTCYSIGLWDLEGGPLNQPDLK